MVISLRRAVFLSLVPSHVFAQHRIPHHHRRAISSASDLASNYDFVIAGGGLAGLVLAARLSEDSNHTVLVLEAGQSGDAVIDQINAPTDTYFNSLIGSSYDWTYSTTVQANASNRALTWSRGKVLGGSSAINGMYSIRPSKAEVDAWGNLVAVSGGKNTTWTWDDLLPYMEKSETYVAPDSAVSGYVSAQNAATSRGTTGPLRTSYPAYMPEIVGNWLPSMAAAGVEVSADPYSGETTGAFFATSMINPSNWTRSYSRSAYLDPAVGRSNLLIVVNATVSKIVLDQSGVLAKATAVQFMTAGGSQAQSVTVNKEVILAGGTIGSPQILQLSGIGPETIVKAAGISSTIDLPGVGQHLYDHLSTQLAFTTNATTAYTYYHNGDTTTAGGEAELMSFINSATAYLNLTTLLGSNSASSWASSVSSALDSSASTLSPSSDSKVIAGYKAIYNASQSLLNTGVGQIEVLFSVTEGADIAAIQIALQRPFSQGEIYINSSNPYGYPVIDPKYLSHPADVEMLRAAAKFVRTLAATSPLSSIITAETSPGTSVTSDDDLDTWLAGSVGTEYHPSGSCAMLPLEQGGVVDTELIVYGTSNVRVIDASIFPISFAAHLMAPTYGLAERGAAMIRTQYNVNSSTTSTAPSSGETSTTSTNNTSGAARFMTGLAPVFAAGAALLSLCSL